MVKFNNFINSIKITTFFLPVFLLAAIVFSNPIEKSDHVDESIEYETTGEPQQQNERHHQKRPISDSSIHEKSNDEKTASEIGDENTSKPDDSKASREIKESRENRDKHVEKPEKNPTKKLETDGGKKPKEKPDTAQNESEEEADDIPEKQEDDADGEKEPPAAGTTAAPPKDSTTPKDSENSVDTLLLNVYNLAICTLISIYFIENTYFLRHK